MRSGRLVAGRFLLQEKLGTGPVGATFQGIDQSTQQPVAIKMIDGQRAQVGSFPAPLRTLLGLELPGLVRPLAHGLDEQNAYFARPWNDAEPLELRLWRTPLPWTEALALLRSLATILVPLHQRGLAHLGIAPSNVLWRNDRAWLLDAGVALLPSPNPRLRVRPSQDLQANVAPEQAQSSRPADARADVFSLGVLLREVLTSRPAFPGAFPIAALGRLVAVSTRTLSSYDLDVPPWAEEMLATLMASDPAQRPASATELLRLLDRFTARPAEPARPPAFADRFQQIQAALLLGGRSMVVRPDAAAQADQLTRALGPAARTSHRLADDTLLCATSPRRPLLEQLTQLGRAALEVRRQHPLIPMVIVAGRGELLGGLIDGDLMDRGAALLPIELRRATSTNQTVRVDGLSAALLEGHLPVGHDDQGYLIGVKAAPPAAIEDADEAPPTHDDEERSVDLALASAQSRLDALPAPVRRALTAASILGPVAWPGAIEAVLGAPFSLEPLLDGGLLERRPATSPSLGDELAFAHHDLRLAAYGSLLDADRRQGHRRAAAWLEPRGAPTEQVARHWDLSHDSDGFVEFAMRAAIASLGRGDVEDALQWLDRGEGSGAESLGLLLTLRTQLLVRLGQRASARRSALRALESLPRDGAEGVVVQGWLVETCAQVGDVKRLVNVTERVAALSPPDDLRLLCSRALVRGAVALFQIGKVERADAVLRQASELAGSAPPADLQAALLRARALRARISGFPAAALTLLRAAAGLLARADLPEDVALTDVELASALLDTGLSAEAELHASHSLALARRHSFAEIEARGKVVLALSIHRRAGLELARSTVREATSFFGGRGSKLAEGEARCALAWILLHSSDTEGARREIERAQGVLAPYPEAHFRALRLLAQVQLSIGLPAEAARTCDQATGVADPIMTLLDAAASLRPLRAQIAQIDGDRAEAHRLFGEAERLLLQRAEAFDDPRTRDAFLKNVPEHARILQFARLLSVAPPSRDDPEG